MGESLRACVPAVAKHWWTIFVGVVAGGVGAWSLVAHADPLLVPAPVWLAVALVAVLVAQFLAFHDLRRSAPDRSPREIRRWLDATQAPRLVEEGGRRRLIYRLPWDDASVSPHTVLVALGLEDSAHTGGPRCTECAIRAGGGAAELDCPYDIPIDPRELARLNVRRLRARANG